MTSSNRLQPAFYHLLTKGGIDEINTQYAFFSARRIVWFRATTNSSGIFSVTWDADTWPDGVTYYVRTVNSAVYPTDDLDLPPIITTDVADYETDLEVKCLKWDYATISGTDVIKKTPVATSTRLLHIVCFDPQTAPDTLTNES